MRGEMWGREERKWKREGEERKEKSCVWEGKRGERGREGKERDKREERWGNYCMNSPRSSRKVGGAKRMDMPREAVGNLSGKQEKLCIFLRAVVLRFTVGYFINASLHCTLSFFFFSRTCCVV